LDRWILSLHLEIDNFQKKDSLMLGLSYIKDVLELAEGGGVDE